MVRTWIADIRCLLEDSCYARYYEQLPDFRREKAKRIRDPLKRAQSVGVWALWEEIKNKYSLTQDNICNFSHSGFYVLCAAETERDRGVQVGCDIESVKPVNLKLALRFFCPLEYEKIKAVQNKEEQEELFCRYWVCKESFIKAVRRGMGLPMNTFEIQLEGRPRLARQPEEFRDTYYFCEYRIEDGPYRMAVCSTQSQIDSKIQTEFKLG